MVAKSKTLQLILQKYKILRDYYEKLYVNKLDKIEEMETFLDTYQDWIVKKRENLNRTLINKGMEWGVKSPIKENQGSDGLMFAIH